MSQSGAGEGNRTLVASLEGWSSAIELRPLCQRTRDSISFPAVRFNGEFMTITSIAAIACAFSIHWLHPRAGAAARSRPRLRIVGASRGEAPSFLWQPTSMTLQGEYSKSLLLSPKAGKVYGASPVMLGHKNFTLPSAPSLLGANDSLAALRSPSRSLGLARDLPRRPGKAEGAESRE